MKKLFPLLILMVLLTGCIQKPVQGILDATNPAKVETFVDDKVLIAQQSLTKILKPSYGYTYLLIALEINSNISSLIIDKTKEKVVSYDAQAIKKLRPGSFFYVIPPRVTDGESFYFDEELGRRIRNYVALAKYGVPVTNPEDAEYIMVTNIKESLSKTYGTNYSEVALSIVDKFDSPIFAASIRVESKSDRNFWYFATKKAKPVKELTMKGLSHIMAEGMPEVHGEPHSFATYAQSLSDKAQEKVK